MTATTLPTSPAAARDARALARCRAAGERALSQRIVSFGKPYKVGWLDYLEDQTTLAYIAEHAGAIHDQAQALIEDSTRWDRRERAPGGTVASLPPRTVQPGTMDRLQALCEEFRDDPDGIALLIDLAQAWCPDAAGPVPQKDEAPT